MKRHIRVLRVFQRALSLILSLLVVLTMATTLAKFFSTRAGTPRAWPSNPALYPTYTLISVSAVVLILDVVALISYCCGVKAANRASDMSSYVQYLALAIGWAAGAGVFKWANSHSNRTDLWGWSCSDAADLFETVNDSGMLCHANVSAVWDRGGPR